MADRTRKKSIFRIVVEIVLTVLAVFIVLFVGFIAFSSITEWKPKDEEVAEFYREKDQDPTKKEISLGKEYSVLSFNIGYCGLGEDADFFMDGGKGVLAKSKSQVGENLDGILNIVGKTNADFNCIQELDRSSRRSFYIDDKPPFDYRNKGNSSYADNFNTFFLPFPLGEMMGKVKSGLYTQSKYEIGKGTRVSLPVPFKWPVRMFNLKRCLLVNRVPIKDSDKELVLINLHLEAYDDGTGKAEQTKALMEYAENEYKKGNYVVAVGDWNQSFFKDEGIYKMPDDLWKPSEIDLGKGFEHWKLVFDKETPSCRLDNQPYTKQDENTYYYIIDGGIVSPNVKVDKVTTLNENFKYSDHNPVEIKFTLEK